MNVFPISIYMYIQCSKKEVILHQKCNPILYIMFYQPLQAISVGLTEEEDAYPFYVLSGTQLQKWTIGEGMIEKVRDKAMSGKFVNQLNQ